MESFLACSDWPVHTNSHDICDDCWSITVSSVSSIDYIYYCTKQNLVISITLLYPSVCHEHSALFQAINDEDLKAVFRNRRHWTHACYLWWAICNRKFSVMFTVIHVNCDKLSRCERFVWWFTMVYPSVCHEHSALFLHIGKTCVVLQKLEFSCGACALNHLIYVSGLWELRGDAKLQAFHILFFKLAFDEFREKNYILLLCIRNLATNVQLRYLNVVRGVQIKVAM